MKKYQKEPGPRVRKRSEPEKAGGSETEVKAEADCRCKEVSKKSVPEMFNLMIEDLAFWKKISKREK